MSVMTETEAALDNVRGVLSYLGEDPDRDGLAETPRRVLAAFAELTAGYRTDPATILSVTFTQDQPAYEGIIAAIDVPFTSTCEHHLMPFTGTASVAYIPEVGAPLVGLSKLARLVDIFALRLQIQERMTAQVVTALTDHLATRGAACVVRAEHSCMARRGVKKTASAMVTSELRGRFLDDPRAREELFLLLGH